MKPRLAHPNNTRTEDAFRELVGRYLGVVPACAHRVTSSREFAEEVAQNVFCVLAKKARRIGPATALGALETSPSRDAAIRAFSVVLVGIEPDSAIQWSESISDPARRSKSLEYLAGRWLRDDRESATRWPLKTSSDLSAEARARLLRR